MKYTTVMVHGIILQIALTTEIVGYTEGVLEAFLPDEKTLNTEKKVKDWTKKNNNRMEAICKFLNENNL